MEDIIERAEKYNSAFPNFPPLVWTDRWVYGIWVLGNQYRSKQGYYGEYPPTYLKRIMSMFNDVPPNNILHLFSGTIHNQGVTDSAKKKVETNE